MHVHSQLRVGATSHVARYPDTGTSLACINLHKLIPMQTKRFDVELGYQGKPPRLTSRLKRAPICVQGHAASRASRPLPPSPAVRLLKHVHAYVCTCKRYPMYTCISGVNDTDRVNANLRRRVDGIIIAKSS